MPAVEEEEARENGLEALRGRWAAVDSGVGSRMTVTVPWPRVVGRAVGRRPESA